MKKERDFRAEYELLRKQYEESKRLEEENAKGNYSGSDAEEFAKFAEALAEKDWKKRIPEDKIGLYNILSRILVVSFVSMIIFEFIASIFLGPVIVWGSAAIFFGVIIFSISFVKEPAFAIVTSVLLIAAGIAIFKKNLLALCFIIISIFIINFVISTIKGIVIFIRLLRWIKTMKKVCTEKAAATCINTNQKIFPDLEKENIELIPRYTREVKSEGSGVYYLLKNVYRLCSPIYELDYYGAKYTLCDNYYGITKVIEGESREIFINPENPQEFYDVKRYKSEAWKIFNTTNILPIIIEVAIIIIANILSA